MPSREKCMMSRTGRNMCAISSVYLFSKIFELTYYHSDDIRYRHCIYTLGLGVLDVEDAYKTCDALNSVSNLQTFVSDFAKGLMAIYVLIGAVMARDINIKYWLVAHVSALAFSYIGTLEKFQFSYDSSTKYDEFKVFIACGCLMLLLPLIVWNLMAKSVAKGHLLGFCAYYTACYLLYLSSTRNIEYHLHHSLLCTFMSYFYTDWSLELNVYAHSILIGIVVQGIAFYKVDEYDMLNISNDIDAGWAQISIIYSFILTYVIYSIARSRVGVEWNDLDDDDSGSNEDASCTGHLYTIEEGNEYD